MKIFILEDSQERIFALEQALRVFSGGPHEVTIRKWVEGRDGAKRAFTPPYDILLLDHDLGGEQMVDPDEEETGATFCKWLVTQGTDPKGPLVVIHSYNPEGATVMERTLRDGGFNKVYKEPFGRTLLSFLASISSEKAAA